ncbi:hypothetical protein [Lysinibacillus antri]|uniref:Uncharacterized protein n=1 Tax=Lysinibacillus antri TaxID=2498145 RepID=A0A3S0P536_9BACI|nr:hypothetical protein [Lysinibacillus antri]RUL51105.1 hypothetical protein EK386_12920 [Lysinibacillus antri]
MQIKEYELLNQYKEQNTKRADALQQYQQALTDAKSRLQELETQYDYTFTTSVSKGEDKAKELDKINDDISLQREVVARREHDYKLANQALPDGDITSVDVVNEYNSTFRKEIQSEYVPLVEDKLKLARDLILSAIMDHREYSAAYSDLSQEMKEITMANHSSGKTSLINPAHHPTDEAHVLGKAGVIKAVQGVLNDVSGFTYGKTPYNFQYIAKAPKLEKGAK